jgi:hypothetical protein
VIRYSLAVEGHMEHFYDSLSEKDRRRYAAVEAVKLVDRSMGRLLIRCAPMGTVGVSLTHNDEERDSSEEKQRP